jgi:nucleotide-binding universal stress UspA family protein
MQAVQARTRITLKNILFATDFSQAADAAAPMAIQIARRYGAKVYGVHVNRFDDYTASAPKCLGGDGGSSGEGNQGGCRTPE